MPYIVSYESLYLYDLEGSFPQESTHIPLQNQKETLVFVETNSFSSQVSNFVAILLKYALMRMRTSVRNQKLLDAYNAAKTLKIEYSEKVLKFSVSEWMVVVIRSVCNNQAHY